MLKTCGIIILIWRLKSPIEVMDIQATLVGHDLDREKIIKGFEAGIDGDHEHMCMGRSAPGRLARAVEIADNAGLEVKKLREIKTQTV